MKYPLKDEIKNKTYQDRIKKCKELFENKPRPSQGRGGNIGFSLQIFMSYK